MRLVFSEERGVRSGELRNGIAEHYFIPKSSFKIRN